MSVSVGKLRRGLCWWTLISWFVSGVDKSEPQILLLKNRTFFNDKVGDAERNKGLSDALSLRKLVRILGYIMCDEKTGHRANHRKS